MCVVALKSMTYAIKAKKVFDRYLIYTEIIKLEPHMTKKGCNYGVKFECININAVEDALKNNSVKYTEIINL